MKRKLKKWIALLLAILTMFSVSIPVLAADVQGKMSVIDLPRGSDPNKTGWGHPTLTFMNGWHSAASNKQTALSMYGYEGATCYCIEPGVSVHTGNSLSQKGEDFWEFYPSNYNQTIQPNEIKQFIGRILQYGWTGNNSLNWISTNATYADQMGEAFATQCLIWETVVGERDANFNKVNANNYGCNNILNFFSSDNPVRAQIMAHYYDIEAKVKRHKAIPSFCAKDKAAAQTVELQYDGSRYTATIADNNWVLSDYSFSSSDPNLSLSQNGNQLTISTAAPPVGDISIQANKINSNRRAVVTWTDGVIGPNGNIQDLITYGEQVTDPVQGFIKVKAAAGNCEIKKTAEDGYKAGFQFQVTGAGIDRTVTTGDNGGFTLSNIPAGTYTATEINTENRYVQPSSQTVTVNAGQTASVSFNNRLKRGVAMFQKTDFETNKEIESKDGIFGVYEWSNREKQYNRIAAMTYNEGEAAYVTSKLPVTITNDGKYKIVEEKAPTGYVRPTNVEYEFQIQQDEEIHKLGENGVVVNTPQKGKIRISKTDEETEKALANAVYSIVADGDIIVNGDVKYKSGTLIDTITTEKAGKAESRDLYLGNYIVFEKTAPDGYTINKEKYKVTLAYQGDTVDVFVKTLSPADKPQKGKFEITKQGEVLTGFDFMGTELGIKHTPIYEVKNLANATYEIYALNDVVLNGDVKYPKGELVDTITTGDNGVAVSKNLYLGDYRIVETVAPEGFFIGSNEYEVTLSYQGQDVEIFSVAITSENERQHMKLTLQKEIEENTYYPNPDAYQDIIFGIFTAEDIVTGTENEILLEKDSLVDCFGITESGQGISITDLPFGKYYVKELKTAEGYVQNKNIYPFQFDPLEQSIPVIWIDLNENETKILNETIKGKVEIRKNSNFDDRPLPKAIYGIYRETDDLLIQTLKTQNIDEKHMGYAISDLIPYGKYYIKEIEPPEHYHPDLNKYPFFIGENGEETITLSFDLKDTPVIGGLLPEYDEKGWKEALDGKLIPKTGDSSFLFVFAVLAIISAGTILIFAVYKRRQETNKKK